MAAGGPTTTGVSRQLWQDSLPLAYQSLHCPFVNSLAHGVLERETFQHYIAQDVFYLKGFAKAYALALAKADALEDEQYKLLSELLRGVQREVQLHTGFLVEWGLDPEAAVVPNQATTAYVDFLLSVAEGTKGVAHILAAMLPCSRLYGFIGCQLAEGIPNVDHQYASWIRTYSSPEYLALPAQKEVLLDALASSIPFGELRALYRKAMQMEVDFFCAQPGTPPHRNIRLLVADFDETLTQSDTIGRLLALAGDAAAVAAGGDTEKAAAARRVAEERVQQLAANYAQRHKALMQQLLPADGEVAPESPLAPSPRIPASPPLEALDSPQHTSSQPQEVPPSGPLHIQTRAPAGPEGKRVSVSGVEEQGFDLEVVAALLHRLSDFDTEMNAVVEQSGILEGLTAESILAAARKVELRPGAQAVLLRALALRQRVHVVSVNWSAEFVAAALQVPAHITSGSEYSPGRRPVVVVHANQLEVGPGGRTTGALVKQVQHAVDKGRVFEELLMADVGSSPLSRSGSLQLAPMSPTTAAGGSAAGARAPGNLYVGDSASDVLPLLEADFGIVVGNNALLRRVLQEFEVPVKPLCSAPLEPPPNSGSAPVLYEAADWHEISAFLFGPDPTPKHTPQHRPTTRQQPAASTAGAPRVPRVLAVAGSDSGGGAGIQADLKACMARGAFGMSAVTALTAQNTQGVLSVHSTPLGFLKEQIDAVLSDIGADVVKTGMLPSAEAVEVVASAIERWRVPALVVDPVMVSTSGHQLAAGGAAAAIRDRLLPLATVATPNVPEASALLGGMEISSVDGMKEAARRLQALGPRWVLLKGGHLLQQGGAPARQLAVDVLCGEGRCLELVEEGVATGNTHGTGCTLASAIAAELAKGQDVVAAVTAAKHYITQALHHSVALSIGTGSQKPFNAGYELADWQAGPQQGIRMPLDLRVYAVTDPLCNQRTGRTMEEAVRAACEGGATILQLREKDCDGGDFIATARCALQVARGYGVPLLINDRVDVALAAGADGVHVGQSDLPAAAVRRLLGPHKILGVSVKTPEEAVAAHGAGADYLGAGAVYPTSTKDSGVIGLAGLATVCAATPLPVVSIGGVTAANAAATIEAGCAGVAVVSHIFGAQRPDEAARQLLAVVNAALRSRS